MFVVLLSLLALALFVIGFYSDHVVKAILDGLGLALTLCALGVLVVSGAFI